MTLYKKGLINKISMPVLPDVLLREHLFELLEDNKHYRGTWISSPPGSGKTTLVASYINHLARPYLWYQFDSADDEMTFFYYLELTVKTAYPDIKPKLPKFDPRFESDPMRGLNAFSRKFFERLSCEVRQPLTIVFDNYQEIDKASHLHEIVKSGIQSASERLHFIIMSRGKPHTAYISDIANKRIRVVTENSLMMNRKESIRIFEKETGTTISEAVADQIFRKTSGWVAGLILLALNCKDKSTSEDEMDMDHEHIDDYFSSELFNQLPPQIQDFLLKASILQEIIPEVMEDLTDIPDPLSLLAEMHANKYFIEKYSDKNQAYQLHPLFKAYLQRRLDRYLSRKEQSALRVNAALSLERHENYTQAINLLILAGDTKNLVRILHEKARLFHLLEMYQPLVNWIAHIPEKTLKNEPWLLYWLGYSYCYLNTQRSMQYLDSAFRIFEKAKDLPGFLHSWVAITGSIYHARNNYSLLDNQIAIYEAHIQQLDKYPTVEIHIGILVNIVKAWLARRPDHPELLNKLKEVIALYSGSQNKAYANQVVMMAIDYCYFTGNYFDRVFIDSEIEEISRLDLIDPFEYLFTRTFEIKSHFWTEQSVTELLDISENALKSADKNGINSYTQVFYSGAIYASLVMGDLERAEKHLSSFRLILNYHHYKSYMLYYFFNSMFHLNQKNADQAPDLAEKALQASEKVGQKYWELMCRFGYAQALGAQKSYQHALDEYSLTHEMAGRYNSLILQYMCRLGKAHIYLKSNKRKKADQHLKAALAIGQKHGFIRLLWWHEPDFLSVLCNRALQKGIETQFALKMIAAYQLKPPSPDEASRHWPWPVKILTMGKFALHIDGTPLNFRKKSQQKPLELLKIIIAHYGIVSAETAMDLLWGDTDGDLATISLNTTINRLRNILKHRDSIILSDGKISLNAQICFVDMIDFHHLSRRIKKSKKKNISLLKQAVENYRDHFLVFEKEKPWIMLPRQKLQEYFFHFILDLAGYYEKRENYQKAIAICRHGLDIIPSEEVFYTKIMEYYLKRNKPGMVKRTFYDCSKMLGIINRIPSSETRKLIEKANHSS